MKPIKIQYSSFRENFFPLPPLNQILFEDVFLKNSKNFLENVFLKKSLHVWEFM